MGMMHHHAVVATTWSPERFKAAVEYIHAMDPKDRSHFLIGDPGMNGEATIVVVPDGSKEGWLDSELGDTRRADFIAFLKTHDFDDGSSPWMWVEVSFGELGASVESTNCENKY